MKSGKVEIMKVHTDQNLMYPFTKLMPVATHESYLADIIFRSVDTFVLIFSILDIWTS